MLTRQYSEKITGTNDWKKVTVTIDDEEYDVNDLHGIFYIERMRSNGAVWVDDVKLRKGDSQQNSNITYEYDHRANRDYSSIKLPNGTEEEQIYRYDNINRLKKTKFRESGDSLKYEYTYDPVGNRTLKTVIEYPNDYEYSYNYNTNNNRLTSISETGVSYTYNNRGDLITETGGYTFEYDREGRLEEVKKIIGSDTNKFNFQYTSEGRRLRKVHYRDSSGVIEGDTTYYVYDGMNVVAELDGSLDLKSKYIYASGMLVGSINKDDELYQYFHDGLGSITMICDSTGSHQNLYVYDDFGNFKMMEETGWVPNNYYYTGQERDESPSGLYNLRARYYASGIGRFTQEDPIWQNTVRRKLLPFWEYDYIYGSCTSTGSCGSSNKPIAPQDNNPYVYCNNNPVNMIDPEGLFGVPRIPRTNWCGTDYAGGIHKPLEYFTRKDLKNTKLPNSKLDYCCMLHDYCFYKCRFIEGQPGTSFCHFKCNVELGLCLSFIMTGPIAYYH